MVEREPQVDVLAVYLREVGKAPLLEVEEEIELARQRDQGRRAEARLRELEKDGLRPEERKELEFSIAQGENARDRLAKSNLRLVTYIAKRYRGLGMTFLDLIQEGNVGLMRAVDKFDPDRGAKFSTFAFDWIRQAITRALPEQGRTIRVPIHANEELIQLERMKAKLVGEIGREPNQKELAEALSWKEEKVKSILEIPKISCSLDMPTGVEEDSYLGELIEDTDGLSPPDGATKEILGEQVREAVDSLTPREAKVLELRFGLKDGQDRTLEEVGGEFGLTRERIRQIESEALRKLRHPSRARGLK